MNNFIFSKKVLKSVVLIMFLILSTLAIIFFPYIKGKIKKQENAGEIYQQSLSLIEKGDFKQATELLEKTIKISPDAINYLQTLAIAKYNSKDYQGAISVYEKMIKIDSKSAFAYNGIGNAFRDLKDFKQAEENYQKAIEIDQHFIASYT
ncbi:tetratricopeptide repeat protein, partial [Patescibacteria group bacterium]|nr:tetratricopeptide repeat protein [Patescibacteria group bacterium]